MPNWLKAVFLIIAVGLLLTGLHYFVFAPRAYYWEEINQTLNQSQSRISNIVNQTADISGRDLTSKLKNLQAKVETDRKLLEEDLAQKYDCIIPATRTIPPALESIEKIVKQIEEIKNLAKQAKNSNIRVLSYWGIGEKLGPGKFGSGFDARSGGYLSYSARRIINPQEGSVEMWVKPAWSDAYSKQPHTLFQVKGDLQGGNKDTFRNKQEGQTLSLYFIPDDNVLVAEGRDTHGNYQVQKVPINHWQPDQWHHLALNWNLRGELVLFMDGELASSMLGTGGAGGGANYIRPRAGTYGSGQQNLRFGPMQEFFIGAGEDGENPAQCLIDEFRISNKERTVFDLKNPVSQDSITTFLHSFSSEYIDTRQILPRLREMESQVMLMRDTTLSESYRNSIKKDYEEAKSSLGLDTNELAKMDWTVAILRQLAVLDYLYRNVEGYNRSRLIDLLQLDLDMKQPYKLYALSTYLDLTKEIIRVAEQAGVNTLIGIDLLGESYDLGDKKLFKYFKDKIDELLKKYPDLDPNLAETASDNPYGMYPMGMPYPPGGGGGTGAPVPGAGYGYPGMYGMGYGMIPQAPADLEKMEKERSLLKEWLALAEKHEIPSDVRDEYYESIRQAGKDNYVRKIFRIKLEASLAEMVRFAQKLETAQYLASLSEGYVKKPDTTNREASSALNAELMAEFHFIKLPPDSK